MIFYIQEIVINTRTGNQNTNTRGIVQELVLLNCC